MKVGWTRLSLVAPHVNVEDALFYCEFNSTWAIQQALKSNEMPPFSRFSPCFHDCPREGMMYEHELSRSALAQTVGNPSTRVDTIADLIKTIDVDDKMPLHKRQYICSGVRSLCWAAARQQAVALPFPGQRWRAKVAVSHFHRHPAPYARAARLCDQPTQLSATSPPSTTFPHIPATTTTVQRILGHKNLDTTVTYYCELEAEKAFRHFDAVLLQLEDPKG